jgi:site-specific recombinase XerD
MPKPITLSEAITSYLKIPQLAEETRKTYEKLLRRMAKFVGGDKSLKSITTDHINEYILSMYDGDLAQATINGHIKTIKTFFKKMVERELIKKDPTTELKTKKLDMYGHDEKAMPPEILEKFITLSQPFPRIHALVLALADGAFRRGGGANLTWGDLDFVDGVCTIIGKGGDKYDADFGITASNALKRWRDAQQAYQRKNKLPIGGYVFSKDGQFISAELLAQFFRRRGIAFGLGSWGPHSVRHHKGHQLGNAGVPATLIAQILGQKSVASAYPYLPQSHADAKATARKFHHQSEDDQPISPKIIKFKGG